MTNFILVLFTFICSQAKTQEIKAYVPCQTSEFAFGIIGTFPQLLHFTFV